MVELKTIGYGITAALIMGAAIMAGAGGPAPASNTSFQNATLLENISNT